MVGAGVIENDSAWVASIPSASVSPRVKENGPLAVGVPVTAPVAVLRVRPPGSDPPVTDQVKGAVPPEVVEVTA